jgi:hypothetical protein
LPKSVSSKFLFWSFVVLIGKVRFCRKYFGWLSFWVIRYFGKFCFLPLLKNKSCVKVRHVGSGSGFQSASLAQSQPTKRAPDAGDSGAIPSIFLRLSIFPVGRRSAARPSAGNANRWVDKSENQIRL